MNPSHDDYGTPRAEGVRPTTASSGSYPTPPDAKPSAKVKPEQQKKNATDDFLLYVKDLACDIHGIDREIDAKWKARCEQDAMLSEKLDAALCSGKVKYGVTYLVGKTALLFVRHPVTGMPVCHRTEVVLVTEPIPF